MPKKSVERYCESANKTKHYKVSIPCIDDHHHFKEEKLKSGKIVKCMLSNCSECFHLTRIGDIPWSVNNLARSQNGRKRVTNVYLFDLLHSSHM